MDRKIRLVILDGLTADDVLKLKHGGFFDGAQVPMPTGVTGKEATLKVPTSPVVFPPVAAVPTLEDAPPPVTEQKPAKAKKAKVEEPVPTPSEVIQQMAQLEQEEQAPAAEPTGNAEPIAGAHDTGGIDPEKLASFTKLRDIIQYVIDSGIPPAGVATFCEGVKANVPLLSRIPNITERVARTLEVMGL